MSKTINILIAQPNADRIERVLLRRRNAAGLHSDRRRGARNGAKAALRKNVEVMA